MRSATATTGDARPINGRARRRVSRRRRVIDVFLLLLVAGIWSGYVYLIQSDYLRAEASRILERVTGGRVEVQSATFSLSQGVQLGGVTVTCPVWSQAAAVRGVAAPPLFVAHELQLKVDYHSLLRGRFRFEEIVATDPTLNIVTDPSTGQCNWHGLTPAAKDGSSEGAPPRLRLHGARLRMFELRGDIPAALGRIHLDLEGSPKPSSPDMYAFRWQLRDSSRTAGDATLDTADFAFRTQSAGLPPLPMAAMAAAVALPPELQRWRETLGLNGVIRPVRLMVRSDPHPAVEVELEVRDARLAVPIDADETRLDPDDRFLRLRDVAGRIRVAGRAASVDLAGVIDMPSSRLESQTAPFHVRGQIDGLRTESAGLDDLGFALDLQVDRAPIPERGPNAPSAVNRFIHRWPRLHTFFRDYHPSGSTDIAAKVRKTVDGAIELEELVLTARDAEASFRFFPYRITGLTGVVRIQPDGVLIESLRGDHRGDPVRVDGWMSSPSAYAACALHINGTQIAFSDSLRAALSPRFQYVWDRFEPRGRADIHVHLRRELGDRETGHQPWIPNVRVDFRDAVAAYDGFPYVLESLSGRLHIAPDRFVLDRIRAGRNGTVVTLSGEGVYRGADAGTMNIRVAAKHLPIDDRLLRALPDDARATVESLRLGGRTDFDGRLFYDEAGRMAFDVDARLREGALRPRAVPYALSDVSADVRLTPDAIDVHRLSGTHGDSVVTARGTVRRSSQGRDVSLTVRSDSIALTDELFAALPPRAQAIWTSLEPRGRVGLELDIDFDAGQPKLDALSRVVVEAQDTQVRYAEFPLALNDVRGRVEIEPQATRFIAMTARAGSGRIHLDGTIRRDRGDTVGRLHVNAVNMRFDDALRDALPWRLRRAWNHVEPAGRFDLILPEISYRVPPEGASEWRLEGSARLRDARLQVGQLAESVDGWVEGRATIAGGGASFAIAADLDLNTVTFGQRRLEGVTAGVEQVLGDDVLYVRDFHGDLYGGQCTGQAEVRFGRRGVRYGLSAVVRDVHLDEFLSSNTPKRAPTAQSAGRIDGRFFVGGTNGNPADRHGNGEVHVRQAQLYKLPLLFSILQVLQFSAPEVDGLEDATLRFHLDGPRVVFDDVSVRGPGLSLTGRGTGRTPDSGLDLTLLVSSSRNLPRVPVLTELLEGAARELMVVQIRGSLGRPLVTARPFHSVEEAIRILVQPADRDGAGRFESGSD